MCNGRQQPGLRGISYATLAQGACWCDRSCGVKRSWADRRRRDRERAGARHCQIHRLFVRHSEPVDKDGRAPLLLEHLVDLRRDGRGRSGALYGRIRWQGTGRGRRSRLVWNVEKGSGGPAASGDARGATRGGCGYAPAPGASVIAPACCSRQRGRASPQARARGRYPASDSASFVRLLTPRREPRRRKSGSCGRQCKATPAGGERAV